MPRGDREACTLARWIIKTKAKEVDPGQMARRSCCPGPNTASVFPAACEFLIEADWVREPPNETSFQKRRRLACVTGSESRCEPTGPPPIWTNVSTPLEATSHHPTGGGPLCGNDDECLAYVPGSWFLLPNGTPDLREVRLSQ